MSTIALSLTASIATMTTHLASKLLLKDGDETVDLGDLLGRGKSFVSPIFFMVGWLNKLRFFSWGLVCSVEVGWYCRGARTGE